MISKCFKKISFSTVLTCAIALGCLLCLIKSNVFASAPMLVKSYSSSSQFIVSALDSAIIPDEPDIDNKLKKGCVIVNVKTMCDKSYQNRHPKDWKVRAKKITKKATNGLYDNFNICFKPKKAVSFSSKNASEAVTIYDAFAGKYHTANSSEMIVAFSGRQPSGVAGISYLGKESGGPRVLIFASTYESEAETVQHEIGHTYGLNHCSDNCVMKASGFGYINHFCSKHKKQWKKNRTYYGSQS